MHIPDAEWSGMPEDVKLPPRKLTLEWVVQPDGSRALVFDAATWASYEAEAAARGQTADQMIVTAIVSCIGPIVVDNYALNRFLQADNPDFLRGSKKMKRT
jgi:hypothetical protein